MTFRFLISFLFISIIGLGQTELSFQPSFNGAALLKGHALAGKDSVHFETFRFYVSGIELLKNGKTVWKEKNGFHLIDAAHEKSLSLKLKTPGKLSYDKIKFNLGIDSATNVSGALGGDLDPTKGMYWTWQSGYINLKLEGASNVCNTRNHAFEFHLGGYLTPFFSMQTILLPVKAGKINIKADVARFLSDIKLSEQNQVMSPCTEAVQLSKKAVSMFSVKQ